MERLLLSRSCGQGSGHRPLTLATRAREQQALDGRWLLERVLLVGGYRRPLQAHRHPHAVERLHMSTLGT